LNPLKIIPFLVLAFVLFAMASCSFTKVGQGHVGVRVNNIGTGAGVDAKALGVGWYFTPPGVQIEEYPIFTDNYAWKGDERLTFQDKNGLNVSADVSVAYRADPVKAPILYQKYRVDMDGILAGPLKNTVRNAIVAQASTMPVEDIYGAGKAKLIENARRKADAYLSQFGLRVEQLFWAGNINLPGNIQQQINNRVANEQEALAAQASVATAKANAEIEVAKAEGLSQAAKLKNAAIADSPQIKAIEKWDGHLPTYMTAGSALPFIGQAPNR
jgi:regulator of protease activity HflC (stomatin/prohibitin superfamily)